MDSLSPDMMQFLRAVLSLAFVIALMGGFAYLLKKLGLAASANMKTSEKRRLKIVESLSLDARRRLVIVECDTKQYLIILGPNAETLVDKAISPVDSSSNPSASAS